MDSVFRSAKEKLEREHRETKESGRVKLEREKKANDAAERQREAVEASQRARRLEDIEASMMKVDVNLGEGKDGESSMQVLPQMMIMQGKKMRPEQRGGMSQVANVCGLSDKDSKLRTYYKALLLQQDGAEDGAPVAEEEEEEEEEEVCWEEEA